jgi:hypothetical protein
MISQQQILQVMAASAGLIFLAGCEVVTGGGHYDSRYPTVAQQDQLDVQWGLPPRKAKGAPKRTFQYQMPDEGGGAPAVVQSPEPAQAPVSSPQPAPVPQPPSDAIDPNVLNKLR